jgi:hypothetical protein
MSDAYYQFQKDAEKAKKEFQRHWDLGEYYREQGDRDQANKNFILGFEKYSESIFYGCIGIDDDDIDNEIKISVLCTLYRVLERVYVSFYGKDSKDSNNPYIHKTVLAYLLINMRKVVEKLRNLKSYFDVDDIKAYEDICALINVFNSQFSRKDLSEELEKVARMIESTPPHKTSDETMKTLRFALKKISHIEFLPTFETDDSGCFVATAAYSSSIHPDLDTFRKFRDRTLLTNPLGRLLVSVYYQIGSQLAQYVNRSFHLKKLVRFLLEKLASLMRSRKIWQ